MRYRKKPVVIEARQYTGNNGLEICHWAKGTKEDPSGTCLHVTTLEGIMRANVGDYVIRGLKGEFYPCKPDIFEATYESVEE